MNQTSPLLTATKVVATAAGLFIAAMGLMGSLFYFLQLFLVDIPTVENIVVGVSFAVLGVGLGGALAWQAGRSLLNYGSVEFRPLSVWWLLLIYTLVIITGQLIVYFDVFPAITFPAFHILAAALPPFAILAYIGGVYKGANLLHWREIIVNLSSGAFLATTLAIMAEIMIGLVMLLLAVIATALTPTGLAFLEELVDNLQDPFWVENPDNIEAILLFPPVAIAIAVVFIFLAPALEELLKPVSVALMSYRRPSRIQAWAWGLAAGAGFALVENLFNTVLALDAWGAVMLLRVGGTLMHAIGSGLIALGWQHMLESRRPWRLVGAYVLAVTIHAIWNGAVIGITGISLVTVNATSEITQILTGTAIIALVGVLIVLSIALMVTLVLITKRLKRTTNVETPMEANYGDK